MSFYFRDGRLISESNDLEYQVGELFGKVLETVPGDTIPQPILALGILTEELTPAGVDPEEHIKIVSEDVNDVTTVSVPMKTVRRVMWLLREKQDSLNTERKQTIGDLVSAANLNSPTDPEIIIQEANRQPETTPEIVQELANTDDDGWVHTEASNQNRSSGNSDAEVEDCEFCSAAFRSTNDLMSHSINCDRRPNDARFQCEYCMNEYISEHALNQHLDDCDALDGVFLDSSKTTTNEERPSSQSRTRTKSSSSQQSQARSQGATKTDTIERDVTGVVVHFNSGEGYGFIKSFDSLPDHSVNSDSSEDIFFHQNQYGHHKPEEGQRLQFDVKATDEGLRAINISQAPDAETEAWDDTFASTRPTWGKNS